MYYRTKQIKHKVLATLVPKRTYTGEILYLWEPQYRRGNNDDWHVFSDLSHPNFYGYQTAEEAEAHLEKHNKAWKTLYEGRYPHHEAPPVVDVLSTARQNYRSLYRKEREVNARFAYEKILICLINAQTVEQARDYIQAEIDNATSKIRRDLYRQAFSEL